MRPQATGAQYRPGFTVAELLVAVGIAALLMALALPAVQSARESTRRLDCANRLRQIMLATEAFVAGHDHFPEYGWAGSWERNSVPHIEILPHIDQAVLFRRIDRGDIFGLFTGYNLPKANSLVNDELMRTTVPLYQCPSDRTVSGSCNYRANLGTGANFYPEPPTGPFAACFDPNNANGAYITHRALRPADFKDGLSQTVFYSERVIGDGDERRYDPWRDFSPIPESWPHCTADALRYACAQAAGLSSTHASYGGYTWFFPSKSQTAYDHILPPNSRTPDCSYDDPGVPESWNAAMAARSQHPGLVNAAHGDGSVRAVSSAIDVQVWRALGTRASND